MRRSIHHRATTLEIGLTAGLVAAAGVALIWVSTWKTFDDNGTWRLLCQEFGIVLIAAVALGFLWELVGKRAFADEIFEVARIGVDVRNAALLRIGTSYLDDVDWEGYFAGVRHLDVFVAYGRTWRGAQFQRLQAVAARRDSRIRVFLPDPDNSDLVSRLGLRFNLSADEVRRLIIDAKNEFLGLRQQGGGEVAVHYHDGDPTFSAYRFDGTAVLTLYSHTRARANVPTIVCRTGGTLYDFIRDDLRAIEGQSRNAEEPLQLPAGEGQAE